MTAEAVSLDPQAGVRASRRACALAVMLAVFGMAVAMLGLSQSASAATSPSMQWMTSAGPTITTAGGTMNIGFGTTGVTGVLTGVSNTCNGRVSPPSPPSDCWAAPTAGGFGGPPGLATYIEPEPPAGSAAISSGICCSGPVGGPFGQTTVHTWAFNKPVIGPIFHAVNLGASYVDITGTTTAGAPITLSALAKNNALELTGNRLNGGTEGDFVYECSLDGSPPPLESGCGSIRLGGGLVQQFTMTNVLGVVDLAGDGWAWAVSFPTAPLTKQFSPNRIPQGGTSTLTFTIANPNNPGQGTLSPLDFTDVLPANVSLADGSVSNNGQCGSPSVGDNGGGALGAGDTGVSASNISVAAGATCTITINVTSNTVGNYVNDNNNLSTGVANLIPNASTPLEVYPQADVEIVKSSAGPLVPGEQATYRFTMRNNGPSPAVNEVATDELPSGVSFVSADDGCSHASGTVTCTAPSLALGATRTFEVRVRVDASADSCEELRNTVTISGDIEDPEPVNNESTICNFEKRADLVLSKDPSSGTVAPGGQVMYTLVVKNKGPSDDSNVKVTDPVPAGVTLVSADPAQGSCSIGGGDLSCDLGSLKAGGSTQILVTATLSGSECVTNTARVGGDAFDPNLNNNTDDAKVCPEPPEDSRFDLVVSKTVNKKNPLVGQTVRYRVVVRNNGPDAAPSATVKDTLNAPVDVVSVKVSQGSCTKSIPMTCELGTIAAGGRVTITIRARHLEPASGDCSRRGQRNAASATGDGTDTNPANNLDVAKVCPKVQLRLTKVASVGTVRAGQPFSYTIRTHNPSKVAVSKVRTCDRLPAGLVFVSSKPKAKLSRGQHCWTARSIGAGKSKTYKVTVRALSGASGRLLNTASASSPDTRTGRVRRPVQVIGQQVQPPQPTG